MAIIKNIELTDAVRQAIASIKIKEIAVLEKVNAQLEARINKTLAVLKETEEALVMAKVVLDDAKDNFDTEKLSLERKLAAMQACVDDLKQREQSLFTRCDQLVEQYNQAKQEAAVAKKEVEMLREQAKKK